MGKIASQLHANRYQIPDCEVWGAMLNLHDTNTELPVPQPLLEPTHSSFSVAAMLCDSQPAKASNERELRTALLSNELASWLSVM